MLKYDAIQTVTIFDEPYLTLPQSLTEINAHNAKDHGNALIRARWTIQRLGTSLSGTIQQFNLKDILVQLGILL